MNKRVIKEIFTKNHSLTGVVLFSMALFLIIVMNAFAKAAMVFHTPIEVVFYRSIVALFILLALAAITKQKDIFKTKNPLKHLRRSIAGNLGVILVFWSYSLLPMANVTALLFLSPLLVTAMSALFLKEQVGIYRWSAVITGFAGVLVISDPFHNSFNNYGTLVVLGAAFTTALVSIFLRDMGKTEDTLTTAFYFIAFGFLLSGLYMIFFGTLPHPDALWPLIGTGVAAGIQLIIKTHAYKLAEASLLSPFTYTSIVWATLFGWLFWGEIPTLAVIAGTIIIIASNLFVLWREKRR